MNLEQIKAEVLKNYNMEASHIEKVKNVYKIRILDKDYCLKVIKYEFAHFWFILNVIMHLQSKGFQKIPPIIPTVGGEFYVSIGTNHAYLTPWIDARECNYDNPIDVETAAKTLADFHIKSSGFEVTSDMKPRIGWCRWIENFKHRKNEMLGFKQKIIKKDKLTEFDNIYLTHIEEELARCDGAIEHLITSDYMAIMKTEIDKKELCHHDFAHHNVLIEADGSVNLIDFDYAILDTHLHDLSSFLIRTMKDGKWSLENATRLMDAYNSVYAILSRDIRIMAAIIEFPQAFWQLGIQYYHEMLPWEEEHFLRRLNRIVIDREERQEFVDEFRDFKYGG